MYSLLNKIDDVSVAKERSHETRVGLSHVSGNRLKINMRTSPNLNAAILKQFYISNCFRIRVPDWAYLLPSIVIEFGLRPVMMAIEDIRNVNLYPKELVHEAVLVTNGFNVNQVPKWSAIFAVVHNFEQTTLRTGKQETELLYGISKCTWALNEVAVATQRFLASVASQTLKSGSCMNDWMTYEESNGN